jgi:SAM-dependent methyltransferase
MTQVATDRVFTGLVAELYQAQMVPLIFEPYAADLAVRLSARAPGRVLEVAAGTGVVTRSLAATLPRETILVATDLNDGMLAVASSTPTARPVEWRQADAQDLPFQDASFDAVVCQFGAMFFPDKPKAFAEARRVLRPGGTFLFSVWDRLEENEFADVVTQAVGTLFPADPPRFLARTPHGYWERHVIEGDLARGGFDGPVELATVAARSRASSPRVPAVAYCEGTPLRNEIEARDATRLAEATRRAEEALAARFGTGAVDGKIQAHVVAVTRR